MRALLKIAVVGLGWATSAGATVEVVADSACPYYAMDIAGFATCDGDRVARAAPLVTNAPALQPASTAAVIEKEPRTDRSSVRKVPVRGGTRAAARGKSS